MTCEECGKKIKFGVDGVCPQCGKQLYCECFTERHRGKETYSCVALRELEVNP